MSDAGPNSSTGGAGTDPFEHDDAAYVLGSLSPTERAAFEEHLLECAACRQRVAEVAGVPAMLSAVTFGDLAALPEPERRSGPPARLPGGVPDTLLPALLRRASRQRRRERSLIAGLAAVAAACLLAVAVLVWPDRPSSNPTTADPGQAQAFAQVIPSPVTAKAVVADKAWGTAITVWCHYQSQQVSQDFSYQLVVHARNGAVQELGTWTLPRQRDVEYWSGTALRRSEIQSVDITLPDGTPILRLPV
jgi:hypothetical protein